MKGARIEYVILDECDDRADVSWTDISDYVSLYRSWGPLEGDTAIRVARDLGLVTA